MSYLARSKPHTIFSVIKECGTFSTGCTGYRVNLYSQNHRMVEVGNDLWRSPCPTPAQAGPPTTSFPGPDQLAFEYPQGERLHTLSRQPGSVSGCPHRKIWLFFYLMSKQNSLPFLLCLSLLSLSPATAEYSQKKKKNNPKTLS